MFITILAFFFFYFIFGKVCVVDIPIKCEFSEGGKLSGGDFYFFPEVWYGNILKP